MPSYKGYIAYKLVISTTYAAAVRIHSNVLTRIYFILEE